MQQRGHAQDQVGVVGVEGGGVLDHRDRVAQHVLVALHRVLGKRQRRQLGQELLGQPGLDHDPQALAWRTPEQELVQLFADALARDDPQPLAALGDAGQRLLCRGQLELGGEAGRAQHAQRVVLE